MVPREWQGSGRADEDGGDYVDNVEGLFENQIIISGNVTLISSFVVCRMFCHDLVGPLAWCFRARGQALFRLPDSTDVWSER